MVKKIQKVDIAWLILLLLTVSSGLMGKLAQPGLLVTIVIAFITFLKGRIVVDFFMELGEAKRVIQWVVAGFCSIIPLLMIVTYIWPDKLVSISQSIIGK